MVHDALIFDENHRLLAFKYDTSFSGETAQMLARNVNYEVPALKKQIAKCQQIKKVSYC